MQWYRLKGEFEGMEKTCRHKYETTVTPPGVWDISFEI
jgi:hypothetical protein